jgi:hypothetical protein
VGGIPSADHNCGTKSILKFFGSDFMFVGESAFLRLVGKALLSGDFINGNEKPPVGCVAGLGDSVGDNVVSMHPGNGTHKHPFRKPFPSEDFLHSSDLKIS